MFGSAGDDAATSALARLAGVLDELQNLDMTSLSGDGLLGFLEEWETQKRRCPSVDHLVVAEVGSRGLAGEHGCRDTTTLLSQLLRIHPGEAGDRVRAAAELGPRRGLRGELLAPIFAPVAAAQGGGTISAAQARIITATVNAIPTAVQAEHEEWVQEFLLAQAHLFDPKPLAVLARRICDTLNPDGTAAQECERVRRRELSVRQRPDGSAQLRGELTPICAEAILTVLDSQARPAPATDGVKDPRTAAQRGHDGLQDAMLLLRTGQLPDCGGVAATILLTMTEQQAETKGGFIWS